MKAAIILALYLVESLLAQVLPVSSGPFAVAVLAAYLGSAKLYKRVVYPTVAWLALAFPIGFLGAYLSGTPLGMLSFATPLLIALLWITGGGTPDPSKPFFSRRVAFIGVLVACGFLLLGNAGLDVAFLVRGAQDGRRSGLFSEPSHYALYVLPLWGIAYGEKRYRKWLYPALLLQFILCFSTTAVILLAILLLVGFYMGFRLRGPNLRKLAVTTLQVAVIAVPAYMAANFIQIKGKPIPDYVALRFLGLFAEEGDDANNLSSLVVVQGIEIAQVSFAESRGLGVGLGNLGTSPQILGQITTRRLIAALLGLDRDLNLRDGALLANKLVGELGVQAFLVLFLLILYMRKTKALGDPVQRQYHSVWVGALLCILFVRVLPFFSGPVVMIVLSAATVLTGRPTPVAVNRR